MANVICRDMGLLHPVVAPAFEELRRRLIRAADSGQCRSRFLPFETYRSPERQAELLEGGNEVTRAGPFWSAHQFGMAVDFVASPAPRQWSWSVAEDWDFLRREAEKLGLRRPHSWDMAHIEHPLWHEIQREVAEWNRRLAAVPGGAGPLRL